MGNKIHLACWRGDAAALEFYTRDHEYCSPEYKMPDVFGVYPVHILVYCGHIDERLWGCLFNHMDDYDDFDVTFNGMTAMDLATLTGNVLMRGILSYFQSLLKLRYIYRFGELDCLPYMSDISQLLQSLEPWRHKGISNTFLKKLRPNNINRSLYPGAPPFFTPLFVAVLANDLQLLKKLISKGAKPSLQPPTSEGNFNLLHHAARLDRYSLIPTLVKAGCPIAAVTSPGEFDTPLLIAAHYGHIRSIKALAECPGFSLQTSEGGRALHAAARKGQFLAIHMLVKLGCNVDFNSPHKNCITPLHQAVRGNHFGAVTTLLELGANPRSRTTQQYTAVHLAARYGSADVVSTLIERGLSPYPEELKDSNMSPFVIAICQGELNVLKQLVTCSSKFNCPVPDFWSEFYLLHFALMARFHLKRMKIPSLSKHAHDSIKIPIRFQLSTVEFEYVFTIPHGSTHSDSKYLSDRVSIRFLKEIVKLGSSIMSVEPNTGFLPIHAAAYLDDAEAIQLFLNLGCPKNAFTRLKNSARMTPMQVAAMRDSVNAIKVLIANGCDVGFHHPKDPPPLHVAVYAGSLKAAKALLDGGASVTSENHNGALPIQIAAVRNNIEMIEILVKYGASVSVGFSQYPTKNMIELHRRIDRELDDVFANYKGSSILESLRKLDGDRADSEEDLAVRKHLRRLQHDGSTLYPPLILAIVSCNREAVRKLVELGADPNTHFFGTDALAFAFQFENLVIASDLIACGAKIDAINPVGDRRIHTAIKRDQPDVVQALIDHNCDALSPSCGKFCLTPFQLASYMCRPKILSMLHVLVHDADQRASFDLSPLHLALIAPNRSLTDRDGSFSTCKYEISSQHQEETVNLLLEFSCNVNATDNEGLTPLDIALRYELEKIVYVLTKADGEKGKKIKDKKALNIQIKFLEELLGSVLEENYTLQTRMDEYEDNMGSLKKKAEGMETQLQGLEDQTHHQSHRFMRFMSMHQVDTSGGPFGSKDVEVFLRSFYDGIRRDAEATAVTAELRKQKVIPEPVETKIRRALDRKEANGHLYDHLLSQATVKTLRIVCDVFIKEEGYPRMNELGERMKKELAHTQYVIEI
jgi:ankyrin repeat protein